MSLGIELFYCDSSKVHLVRAADIVANRIYYMALNRNIEKLQYLINQPVLSRSMCGTIINLYLTCWHRLSTGQVEKL